MSYGFGVLNDYVDRAYATARAHGFHERPAKFGGTTEDTRHLLSLLMLITMEVAEAAEAVRKYTVAELASELADICIRTFDLARALGVNLEQEIVNKMAINEERPFKHGGKRA